VPGIFNRAIFNDAIFNTAPVPVTDQPAGGSERHRVYPRWPRTKEQIRKEREALGIIPVKVERVIEKVAAAVVDDQVAASKALHREFERNRIAYRALYAEILRLKIELKRRQQDDEVAVLMLIH
jgi:hypothetical protein